MTTPCLQTRESSLWLWPKAGPRAWNERFSTFVGRLGFVKSSSDTSLYVYSKGNNQAFILLYVDDILFTASTPLRQTLTTFLKQEFEMYDEGRLKFFLSVKVDYNKSGMHLSQSAYDKDSLLRASMQNCNPVPP